MAARDVYIAEIIGSLNQRQHIACRSEHELREAVTLELRGSSGHAICRHVLIFDHITVGTNERLMGTWTIEANGRVTPHIRWQRKAGRS